METQFTSINDTRSLDELLAQSHTAPVVLFKHSLTCPISSAAYEEMARLKTPPRVGLVVVQRARDVSREVERRTGVRHESPQAFVFRNGEAVWSASHWDVTADAVGRVLREHE